MSLYFLIRTLPHPGDPTLITSFKLNYLSKIPAPGTIPLRVRALAYEFGGDA